MIQYIHIFLAALFTFVSFFTKQDAGAICFTLCLAILFYVGIIEKKFVSLGIYFLSFMLIASIVIWPLRQYDFFYWFNYGQPPHNSRISFIQMLNYFLLGAPWEKVYLTLFLITLATNTEKLRDFFRSREKMILTIISLGVIGQAIVTRITSPLPTDHMTYFHAFGFILVVTNTAVSFSIERSKTLAVVMCLTIIICFSAGYWKYIAGFLKIQTEDDIPFRTVASVSGATTAPVPWNTCAIYGFDKITLPQPTIDGMDRLLRSGWAHKKGLKVLNMSEITPLALSLKYQPLTNQPLWYHLNIGIFQREVDDICKKVKDQYYDIVLFEDIPSLNNFYPYQVRDSLYRYYDEKDKFLAPRKLEDSYIQVFVKKQQHTADISY